MNSTVTPVTAMSVSAFLKKAGFARAERIPSTVRGYYRTSQGYTVKGHRFSNDVEVSLVGYAGLSDLNGRQAEYDRIQATLEENGYAVRLVKHGDITSMVVVQGKRTEFAPEDEVTPVESQPQASKADPLAHPDAPKIEYPQVPVSYFRANTVKAMTTSLLWVAAAEGAVTAWGYDKESQAFFVQVQGQQRTYRYADGQMHAFLTGYFALYRALQNGPVVLNEETFDLAPRKA